MRTKNKLFILLLVLTFTVLMVMPASARTFVSIATGGTGGVYYPLGGTMANIFNEHIDGMMANAESTGASIANVQQVLRGENELALVQNDIAYYAYNGIEMYEEQEGFTTLRGMATLYPETIQIIASGRSGIESVADLAGKRVAVGDIGSGTEANARQILAAYGMDYDDFSPDFLSFREAADNLRDGHIDAAFITAGFPTASITELALTADIKLIPVETDKIAALIEEYPFYAEVEVPAGTYENQDEDTSTVAVMAMLMVPEDLDEELAYNMTRALFENLDTLAAAHARGADVTLETALDGMSLPLHPGAQKYFDEVL